MPRLGDVGRDAEWTILEPAPPLTPETIEHLSAGTIPVRLMSLAEILEQFGDPADSVDAMSREASKQHGQCNCADSGASMPALCPTNVDLGGSE